MTGLEVTVVEDADGTGWPVDEHVLLLLDGRVVVRSLLLSFNEDVVENTSIAPCFRVTGVIGHNDSVNNGDAVEVDFDARDGAFFVDADGVSYINWLW